ISSCMEDTLGRAAQAYPPFLADRRKCIVYGRGIPYGERLHAFKESAPWQPRNALHSVNHPSRLTHHVFLSRPLMPWCTPSTTLPTNRSTIRDLKRLPSQVQARIDELYELAQRDPPQAIPELERLMATYPHIPTFANHLSIAYLAAGDQEQATVLVR